MGVAITDVCSGLYLHGAIMAALLARAQTGKGQRIDTSILEVQVATLANIGHNYLIAGQEAKRWGTQHEVQYPQPSPCLVYRHFTLHDTTCLHVLRALCRTKRFARATGISPPVL